MHKVISQPALLQGQASRIPAEQKLAAQPAILRATITVTRAGTGKVETFEIVGTTEPQTGEVSV